MSKQKEEKDDQLKLSLKQSLFSGIAKYKNRFELFRAKWDIRRYTKSNWVWFTIIISISLLATQIYTIIEKFSLLPTQIPIFQIFVDADMTLAKREFIYLVPAISLVLIIVGVIFSNRYYNKERNLANTLLWTMLLAVTVATLALIRLIDTY
ncbi:MAG: hypothetical protein PHP08_02625 [Candidatus Dojkabacteria bacterium]|nr:hypothetical protein [Candidatus Dojkabacteria bacterium]